MTLPFSEAFFNAVDKTVAVFDQLGTDWMFIGAVPVAIWGHPRATTDADFAISLDFLSSPDLDSAMKAARFERISGPLEIPGKRLVLSKYAVAYDSGTLGIDVFFVTGYDVGRFLREALGRKVAITFFGKFYWATTAEDLVLFKALAFRSKDVIDLAGVFEERFDRLDWDYIKRWARELRLEQLLAQTVKEFIEHTGSGADPFAE